MKKLISLFATVVIIAAASAQDTIPAKKNFPDSSRMTTTDSMSKTPGDTSLLNQNKKWPDTSINKNKPDSMAANAQATTTATPDATAATAKTTAADRVVMTDDKVMVVKNGDSTLLSDSIKLESGAVVTKDGTVTYTSGKSAKLKNGQYVSLTAVPDNTSQADSSSATGTSDATATATKAADEDKVIMVGDKVYVIKSGDSTVLADSIKLKSGALVKSDATVKFKDGTSTTLKNGQYIALNPPTPPAETKTEADTKTATATTTTTTTGTETATAATTKPVEDRVVMKDDKIIVVKNGDSTELADSIKLSSGAVVKKDGSVIFKNGSTTKLKNGQFIGLNPPAEGKKTKKAGATSKKKANG
ncbi:MAG: DUF6799 domain-containing protein [Ferruginibacter sp.]